MSQENVEIVRRLLEVTRAEDASAAVHLLDPDLEWIPLRAATEGAYRGIEGYLKFVADTDESFEIFESHLELHDAGDRVLAWGTIHLRGGGSGVEFDVPVGGIFDFRDGRIIRWQDFGSREAALEAAGLSG
jgi:ketosteroid isomerase-like protein